MKNLNQLYLFSIAFILGVFVLFVDESQAASNQPINNNQVIVVHSQLDYNLSRKKLLDFLEDKNLQLFAEFRTLAN